MTNLEAMKALLSDPTIAAGEANNTIEFHWYSGEELGLLGSGEIFDSYAADGVVVKAMLQQDMTAWGDNPSKYYFIIIPQPSFLDIKVQQTVRVCLGVVNGWNR